MVGRTRRVRLIVAAAAAFLVYFLYKSTLSVRLNSYFNHFKQNAIKAGIEGSTWEPLPEDPEGWAVEWAWEPRAFQPVTRILPPVDMPIPMDVLSSMEAEASASSAAVAAGLPWPPVMEATTTPAHGVAPTSTADALEPRITRALGFDQDPILQYEVDPAKHPAEQGPASTAMASPASSGPRWTKHSERYPVSTTIPLPTGSPSPIPRIQHSKKATADVERLTAIKEAAKHAWKGFRSRGWGHDEVKPLSGEPRDSFNGWGATLIDSLDTLWIMGMHQEFEEAVAKVNEIDFTTSTRDDIPVFEVTIRYMGGLLAAYDVSGAKYKSLLDKAAELAEHLFAIFDTPNRMPITYYHWKQDTPADKNRATHRASTSIILAELGSLSMEFTRLAQLTGEPKYYDAIARITNAFEAWQNNTRLPGMWPVRFDASGCMKPAAMAASMVDAYLPSDPSTTSPATDFAKQQKASLLEMEKLVASKQPGVGKIEGFTHPLAEGSLDDPANKDKLLHGEFVGLHPKRDIPVPPADVCVPQGLASSSQHAPETFTLGGASDSTYEYLPKEYLLLGGRVDQYRTMYLQSMQTVIDNLLYRPMVPDNRDILVSGDVNMHIDAHGISVPFHIPRAEHLTCFAGGMFALGAKVFNVPQHIDIARRLTDGCIWAYNSTVSKIMPEIFYLVPCDSQTSCTWNETKYHEALDPFMAARVVNAGDDDSSNPSSPILPRAPPPPQPPTYPGPHPAPLVSHTEFVHQKILTDRLPAGITRIDGRKYQLRPEAIESVFYMHRITGDPYWREQGWHMFNAIEKLTRAPHGHSALEDVTVDEPVRNDFMESFWTAETLKYFYLLFDDDEKWSLEEWVLNTEAHFFRREPVPVGRSGNV